MSIPLQIQQFSQLQAYTPIYQQMKAYTQQRQAESADALWLLEHFPTFTQGQAGKSFHILNAGEIPVVQSDRGGQVTYHGPGQLIIYTLFDLKRLPQGLKFFLHFLQETILLLLKKYDILGELQSGAPGVYVKGEKIASLGLRVHRGCTYHGLSLNVHMDLSPFARIHPCGNPHLSITQLHAFCPSLTMQQVQNDLLTIFKEQFPLLYTPAKMELN